MPRFAHLHPLLGGTPDDTIAAIKAMMERLKQHKIAGTVRMSLLDGRQELRSWDLHVKRGRVEPSSDVPSDLELVMTDETWSAIASGRLAPLDAFAAGRMRILGDPQLAIHLYERLKDNGGGATSVCQ